MQITFRKFLFPFLITLCATIFCILSLKGVTSELCHTQGCALYHDIKIFGLSMWWYGIAAFGTLSIVALRKQAQLLFSLVKLGLAIDCLLLLLLNLTSPCANCLIVALFLGVTYLVTRPVQVSYKQRHRFHFIFYLWCVLLIANCLTLIRQEFSTWPIKENEDATVLIFYSPSCPRCQEAVEYYSGKINAEFYPVADQEGDFDKILIMLKAVQENKSMHEALQATLQNQPVQQLNLIEQLQFHFRLLQNKAHVLLTGSHGLPYIEYRGLPKFIATEAKKAEESSQLKSAPTNAPNLEHDLYETLSLEPLTAGQCQEKNCD